MPYYHRNMIMTVVLVVWLLTLVTWVTWVVFTDPPNIPATTASVVATIYVLPGVAAGLWKWRGDKIKGPEH
jgi:hypothetical protein